MTRWLALCADCHAPLRDGLARATERGYVCTRTDCAPITSWLRHMLATPAPKEEPVGANQYGVITEAEKDRMARLYVDGMTLRDVANETGRSKDAVRAALEARGVRRRNGGPMKARKELTYEESEIAYTGDWKRVGLTLVPTEPKRGRAA